MFAQGWMGDWTKAAACAGNANKSRGSVRLCANPGTFPSLPAEPRFLLRSGDGIAVQGCVGKALVYCVAQGGASHDDPLFLLPFTPETAPPSHILCVPLRSGDSAGAGGHPCPDLSPTGSSWRSRAGLPPCSVPPPPSVPTCHQTPLLPVLLAGTTRTTFPRLTGSRLWRVPTSENTDGRLDSGRKGGARVFTKPPLLCVGIFVWRWLCLL